MRRFLAPLIFLAAGCLPAAAQEYADIDVDLPSYPEMQPVEDLPVYYAPGVESNYFFYDGAYWDYTNDAWYSSPWYNGPWTLVDPVYVPTYLLWVPVRYYHRPPAYFRGWAANRPPRWGAHWGPRWQEAHNRIYTGQRAARVERAPLPHYQRGFTRENYPRGAQQGQLHAQQYAWRPREGVVQQQYQARGMQQPQRPSGQQHAEPHAAGGNQDHRGAGEDHRGR
jgi:hypothetical protein